MKNKIEWLKELAVVLCFGAMMYVLTVLVFVL